MKIITDSLGFSLEISIEVGDLGDKRGRHTTYETDGKVQSDSHHKIIITSNLPLEELAEVSAHEAYHLFYSIRHLITVSEEEEALVFGQLVKRIYGYGICSNHS